VCLFCRSYKSIMVEDNMKSNQVMATFAVHVPSSVRCHVTCEREGGYRGRIWYKQLNVCRESCYGMEKKSQTNATCC